MITVIRAKRAILDGAERAVTVVVDDERIAGVLPPDAAVVADREVVLAADEVLLPGLVDTHVHVNEPGRTEWEGFASATRAAATGGVTTLIDMPLNSLPPTVDAAALDAKRKAADGQYTVDVGFWAGIVPGNLSALRPLHIAGALGFKCFLSPSGVDEFPPLSVSELAAALREVASFDGLVIVHAEDPALLGDARGPLYANFLASRPSIAEDSAIATLLRLAADAGARVHVLHLSSASALPQLAAAKAAGIAVTVETCPHYLTLSAEEVADGDTRFKCCPPIREAANREALWRGLAVGTIDAVVTDHSPCPPKLKSPADFGTAWGGIASLQLGLPVVWTHARRRGHRLADVVRWMATAPASIARLAKKGRIEVGCDADLIIFAPDAEFTVGALHHRHPTTPYAGRRLTGLVRNIWLRGGPPGAGRLLSRGV
jgi:allantoinase